MYTDTGYGICSLFIINDPCGRDKSYLVMFLQELVRNGSKRLLSSLKIACYILHALRDIDGSQKFGRALHVGGCLEEGQIGTLCSKDLDGIFDLLATSYEFLDVKDSTFA